MRARLVRPEFWRDELMAGLPGLTRLTYIGLWCVADDEGYLEWRPRQIGADIYPYVSIGRRDKQMASDLDRLVQVGRVRVLSCGNHALIPTLPKYRIAGGKINDRTQKAHLECPDLPVTGIGQVRTNAGTDQSRTGTADSVSVSGSGSGSPSESVSGSYGYSGATPLGGRTRGRGVERTPEGTRR